MFSRSLAAATLVAAALTPHAHAQPEHKVKDGKVTIPIFLTPTDYLKPVARAYLTPQVSEALQGNRVQMFLRCFMEQNSIFNNQDVVNQRDKWNESPLATLPRDQVKNYGGTLLARDIYDAARMTNADWQVLYFMRRDGYNTLLPDVQKMRSLASVLKVRVRGDIASGDHEAAIHNLKSLLGLGRTLEAHPTLIAHLVGVAICTIAMDALEEMIQQPSAPNLYWALIDLPTPLISLRLGAEGERVMRFGAEGERLALYPETDSLRSSSDVSDAEFMKQIDRIHALLLIEKQQKTGAAFQKSEPPDDYKGSMLKKVDNAAEVKAARERIVHLGCDGAMVKQWSPLHVVMHDEALHCELYRDEMLKFINLPYWQARAGVEAALDDINKKTKQWPSLALVPAIANVKRAQTRLEQRVAYLQVLEAIRLHAFKNGGTLPATLADINLPLPVDPVNGKPFEYKVVKGLAILHGENPNPTMEQTNRYYEILLNK